MRKITLHFLHRERDELRGDINLLESGQREVIEVCPKGRKAVTIRCIERLLERLGRFEEMIAVFESRLG